MKKYKNLMDNRKILGLFLVFCVAVEAVLEFQLHRIFVFMWDDNWYATNLVTEQPLAGLRDILQSQVWHYMNWGGRSVSHGLLQLVLMGGELFADVMNMLVTFLLCYLICETAGAKSLLCYCCSFFLLISLNTGCKLSMFWQSGSCNYLYTTNWILFFLLIYVRQMKQPEAKPLAGCIFWILPLGLITGWSNENMGPSCCVTAFLVALYFVKVLKRRPPVWMWLGGVSSLLGSALVILAPGNFVRTALHAEVPLGEALYDRFFMMLMAGMSYLFPSVLFTVIFLLIYLRLGNRLQPFQILLMITFGLSYGAMVLSPTFPNRAAFGPMVLCIVLIISFLQQIDTKNAGYRMSLFFFGLWMWFQGVYTLVYYQIIPL